MNLSSDVGGLLTVLAQHGASAKLPKSTYHCSFCCISLATSCSTFPFAVPSQSSHVPSLFFFPPLFFLLFSCNLCCVLLIFLRARMLSTSAYQSDGEILLCDMHRGDAESLMFTSGSQRFLKRCSGFVRNCLDATSSAE